MEMKVLTSSEVAKHLNGKLEGPDNMIIKGLNSIENAGENDLTFLSSEKYLNYINESKAGTIIINKAFEFQPKQGIAYVIVDDAYKAFVKILELIDRQKNKPKVGVHPSATVDESSLIDPSAYIGANSVIGRNVRIGKNVRIDPNVTIYDNVVIGDGTIIFASSVICSETKVGLNCLIQAGSVIGAEGFGFVEDRSDGSFSRIPQLGHVILEDNVEIGANTTIDRAMVGKTIIRKGVKLDNLVHIAHNCDIGKNSAFAAQVGVSGSVKVGERNRYGGQVGLAGHIEVADDVIIMAQSGVSKSVEKKGIYFGSPIKDRSKAFRIEAAIRQLPEAIVDLHRIKKELLNKKDNKK